MLYFCCRDHARHVAVEDPFPLKQHDDFRKKHDSKIELMAAEDTFQHDSTIELMERSEPEHDPEHQGVKEKKLAVIDKANGTQEVVQMEKMDDDWNLWYADFTSVREGTQCSSHFDRYSWFSNEIKLKAVKDTTFQNNFGCKREHKTLMEAKFRKDATLQGVIYFCCQSGYKLKNHDSDAWEIAQSNHDGKQCTVTYDENSWLMDTVKLAELRGSDNQFSNPFACPKTFPWLANAEYYEDRKSGKNGVLYFCCITGPARATALHDHQALVESEKDEGHSRETWSSSMRERESSIGGSQPWWWYMPNGEKLCTMVYDAYSWGSNRKKFSSILGIRLQQAGMENDFRCPSGYPYLMNAEPHQEATAKHSYEFGIVFFCCKKA